MYINVHSHYSLRYGTMSIETLVEEASAIGVTQMVLTDINASTGISEFMRACDDKNIKAIGGIEFRRDKQLLYLGIACNMEGVRELNEFLSDHNINKKELPDQPPAFKNCFVIFPFGYSGQLTVREFIGIRFSELHFLHGIDLKEMKDKLIALQPVVVKDQEEYALHEYLRGIDLNTVLSKVRPQDKCAQHDTFLAPGQTEARYYKFPFILENTRNLMNSCVLDFPRGKIKLNRKSFTGSKHGDRDLLEKLTLKGMTERYGKTNKIALKKVRDELKVIYDLNFCSYFLITHDIIKYATEQGYYHVGRGSGANSTVAYCLKITEVDPIELDLYFERFLNAERSSPPDFDLDFSWDEREDVQDYIFKRYGREHTALLGTMTTFKDKSIIREIGKVMGLPKSEIDGFTDLTMWESNRANSTFNKIHEIYVKMKDMPNQRSVHPCGIIISEEPITYYTALDMPPAGMPTVQWDMYEAELIGYDKYDILSQRGIGHIKDCVKLIDQNHGKKVNVYNIKSFVRDENLNNRLKRGDTIGCFYIESPAMRQLLIKLKCDNYLNLVAASSIIRPGVAQSGMMSQFIKFHHDPSSVIYLHPVMKEQLSETYGVMVYQEDVIKVGIHFAGMSGTDADILRRGMSGKHRSPAEFKKLIESFHDGAEKLQRPPEIITKVWKQMESFAGYSFSKAHSASYAVESYQSLFLKTYYPREFMVAVLNNYGGFYSRWLYVHELQKAGANVHLPCVNNSSPVVTIRGIEVYLGFVGIRGMDNLLMENICSERTANGNYTSLDDFFRRTSIGLEQALILIRVGALRFTGKSKKALLWDAHLLLHNKNKSANGAELFHIEAKKYVMPELVNTKLEDTYHELELLEYPLTMSMYDLLMTSYRGKIKAKDLVNHIGKIIKLTGLYVCEKRVTTVQKKKMWFGTFLDDQGDFFDTVHFPNTTPHYPFRGAGVYLIEGEVMQDFGVPSIRVTKFAKLAIKGNPVMA